LFVTLYYIEMVEFRKAREEDIDAMLRLDEEFPPRNREKLAREEVLRLMSNPSACWVADDNGRVVAFVLGEKRGKCYLIHSAQIDPSRLGEGLLAKLIDKAVEATGCKSITKFWA
jgi:N-acetylglutamate synthase-like GNAT family acetyltransferase